VDVDIGEDLIDSHDDTSNTVQSFDVQAVGDTIPKYRPNTWIIEEELNSRTDGRVIFVDV